MQEIAPHQRLRSTAGSSKPGVECCSLPSLRLEETESSDTTGVLSEFLLFILLCYLSFSVIYPSESLWLRAGSVVPGSIWQAVDGPLIQHFAFFKVHLEVILGDLRSKVCGFLP